ncbi:lysozyme inhibitor LprI family protein [Pseudovibrio exalbescens]|uniref:lysozyme inhibitor LprI family protein n=1 Tax=Pseudovibrio exalbescens TaxID=197461 RepID=UPI00236649A7|nr:lysozyme inhibitor LprI family protein [Pseudovibrio exalbescens]MDD7909497.1 lysozyme inhibitor LprI family protein [Pseudovibrio exalbescens]
MKTSAAPLLALALTLSAFCASAQEQPDCEATLNAAQRHICANEDYRKAAVDMLNAYNAVEATIRSASVPDDRKALALQRLQNNQSDWVAYRNGTCDIVANLNEAKATQVALCLTKTTQARTDQLKRLGEKGAAFEASSQ